jgi:hypothetical protein
VPLTHASVEDGDPIRGVTAGGAPRPNPSFARGRVCERLGCETLLSVYNEHAFCWVHRREEARLAGALSARVA